MKPRSTPDRDSKYMGLSWQYAAFSKDPSTQVGAMIVSEDNEPLGMGYNGPPKKMDDSKVIWTRPTAKNPDALSKYDLIVHAELNAIDHAECRDIKGAILYVTALPCPPCMLEIVRKEIGKVVYFEFQSHNNSMLQSDASRMKSFEIARRGRVELQKFKGNLNWMPEWTEILKAKQIFGPANK